MTYDWKSSYKSISGVIHLAQINNLRDTQIIKTNIELKKLRNKS